MNAETGARAILRDLGIRGDIVKTMHRAMSVADHDPDVSRFVIHGDETVDPILGRLVECGLLPHPSALWCDE